MPQTIIWSPDDPDDASILLGNILPANNLVLSIQPMPSLTTFQRAAPYLLQLNDDASYWVGTPSVTPRGVYSLLLHKFFGAPG
jgi:hypothetical protein